MSLRSLVLCSDEKTTRVLRRVLGDLEIAVEECTDSDAAIRKLTRQRFEAVIVDCNDEDMAARVLASVRSAPCNKRSIAVAMIDSQTAVRSAFALGAHFVLYKPISAERARTSFRAAHALMKCERRRNVRVAMQIPVTLVSEKGAGQKSAVTSDIGQGGMSVQLARRARNSGPLRIKFTLPGTEHVIVCAAEVAWEGGGRQAGIRFVDLSPEQRGQLKSWLTRHSSEIEQDDPPAACKLTDLSVGGCYVEMAAPFPTNTRVILTLRVAKLESRVEGMVRVMHPESGMGVEFTRTTNQQREHLGKFIRALSDSKEPHPELVVEPEGMDEAVAPGAGQQVADDIDDPLLDLFRRNTDFTIESFRGELRKQRNRHPVTAGAAAASVSA
jgi:CheY-like chemotaxis protein